MNQTSRTEKASITIRRTGLSLGGAIAVVMSFTTNHSILWAMLHGLFGWLYVIYRACGYGGAY